MWVRIVHVNLLKFAEDCKCKRIRDKNVIRFQFKQKYGFESELRFRIVSRRVG